MSEKQAPIGPAPLEVVYREYFGLKENPFSIAPDPHYFYISEKHREALAHLMYGFASDGGFVLLTGDVGTGKTTVCRRMLEQMPDNCEVAFILYPKLTSAELLATICDDFGIAYPEGTESTKVLVAQLYDYLVRMHEQGKKAVLIIEEAQNLTDDVLEQVRLLTNLETNKQKLLQVIMLGQPELNQRLAMQHLRQLSQRITARYHLAPLSREETAGYVSYRLAVAGFARGQLFPRSVLKTLFRLTGGVPRLINVICDRTLMGTYIQGKECVDRKTLITSAREVGGTDVHWRPFSRPYVTVPLSLGILCIVVALLLYIRPSAFQTGGSRRSDSEGKGAAAIARVATKAGLEAGVVKKLESVHAGLEGTTGWEKAATREAALKSLFGQWRVTFKSDSARSACDQAEEQGLACLESRDSLDTLRRLNRPAVLSLADAEQAARYAALIALDGDKATLRVGDEVRTLDIEELGRRWAGKYLLLWRKPPGYNGRSSGNKSRPFLAWINGQLMAAREERGNTGLEMGRRDDLAKRVKEFQVLAGLMPDGKIGPRTLICLTDATRNEDPSLHKTKGAR